MSEKKDWLPSGLKFSFQGEQYQISGFSSGQGYRVFSFTRGSYEWLSKDEVEGQFKWVKI